MKIRALTLALLIAALLFTACSTSSGTSSPNDPDSEEKLTERRSQTLRFIADNSSLPSLPGAYFESVDTDGFEMIEQDGAFVYTSELLGMTYHFKGASTPEASVLTRVRLEKPSYALFGFMVGDRATEANLILSASGFDTQSEKGLYTYTKDSVRIELMHEDNEITSITISI